jgi:hypothetical protein
MNIKEQHIMQSKTSQLLIISPSEHRLAAWFWAGAMSQLRTYPRPRVGSNQSSEVEDLVLLLLHIHGFLISGRARRNVSVDRTGPTQLRYAVYRGTFHRHLAGGIQILTTLHAFAQNDQQISTSAPFPVSTIGNSCKLGTGR